MINTKLIFVDGIGGSGKSTTAHFIARQMEKNNIKAQWFHENEDDHPLKWPEKKENDTKYQLEKRRIETFPQQWKKMIDKFKNDDCVYIIESYLFQDVIWDLLVCHLPKEEIKFHLHELYSYAS